MRYDIGRISDKETIIIVRSESVHSTLFYRMQILKDWKGNGYFVDIKMSEWDNETCETIYETADHWYHVGNLKELMQYNDARVRATLRIFEDEYLRKIKRSK